MGTRLIFLGQVEVTNSVVLFGLIGLAAAVKGFQEIAPHRPYPKPTQVDW